MISVHTSLAQDRFYLLSPSAHVNATGEQCSALNRTSLLTANRACTSLDLALADCLAKSTGNCLFLIANSSSALNASCLRATAGQYDDGRSVSAVSGFPFALEFQSATATSRSIAHSAHNDSDASHTADALSDADSNVTLACLADFALTVSSVAGGVYVTGVELASNSSDVGIHATSNTSLFLDSLRYERAADDGDYATKSLILVHDADRVVMVNCTFGNLNIANPALKSSTLPALLDAAFTDVFVFDSYFYNVNSLKTVCCQFNISEC